MKKKAVPTVQISVRLPAEVYDQIYALADRRKRPMTEEVVEALQSHIKHVGRAEKQAKGDKDKGH